MEDWKKTLENRFKRYQAYVMEVNDELFKLLGELKRDTDLYYNVDVNLEASPAKWEITIQNKTVTIELNEIKSKQFGVESNLKPVKKYEIKEAIENVLVEKFRWDI